MFTEKEIKKMPRKNVTKNEFLKLVKKLYPKKTFASSNFLPKNNGIFLGIHSFDGKTWYRLHLKSLWIKPFNIRYSVHKNTNSGRELLISNFPLPKGKLIINK